MAVTQVPSPRPDTTLTPPPWVNWQTFLAGFDWQQGEHVTLIGPTSGGKTTLALRLLPLRTYKAVFATKPRDPVMDEIVNAGYWLTREWTPGVSNSVVLWPHVNDINATENQKRVFGNAMSSIYRSGGYCMYWDEGTYLADFLGLKKRMEMLWQQGRSLGVSIICGTQRPVNIPLYAYSQATHLFFWQNNDERDLQRIGGLGGFAATPIRLAVSRLGTHEVLYLNTRTGQMLKTKVEV